MTPVDLSVLIVTWNNEETIERCIAAAQRACADVSHEILVWDNASRDATYALAADLLPAEDVVSWERNAGFAAGNNALARRAGGEHLLLLNPDAYLDEAAVVRLLDVLARRGPNAIVGGRLESPDGKAQLASARPFPTSWRTAFWLLARASPYWWSLPESESEVDAVSGALLLIPRRLWRSLGGFDEEYAHSCEDLDLCWRARCAGAHVLYEPGARATHEVGASVVQASPEIEVLRWMGLTRFIRAREGRRGAAVLRTALALQTTAAVIVERLRLRRTSPWNAERTRLLRHWSVYGDLPDLPGPLLTDVSPARSTP